MTFIRLQYRLQGYVLETELLALSKFLYFFTKIYFKSKGSRMKWDWLYSDWFAKMLKRRQRKKMRRRSG